MDFSHSSLSLSGPSEVTHSAMPVLQLVPGSRSWLRESGCPLFGFFRFPKINVSASPAAQDCVLIGKHREPSGVPSSQATPAVGSRIFLSVFIWSLEGGGKIALIKSFYDSAEKRKRLESLKTPTNDTHTQTDSHKRHMNVIK